ncbi:MAG: hypothetical protein LH480_10090 [Rubrivivax sp.]|nr:hypothetical protein [Rubrivivax sp.]
MTTDREAGAIFMIDSEAPWQRVLGDGLLEAQTTLAQLPPEAAGPTQRGWQIVGQAFESGMRALQAIRG